MNKIEEMALEFIELTEKGVTPNLEDYLARIRSVHEKERFLSIIRAKKFLAITSQKLSPSTAFMRSLKEQLLDSMEKSRADFPAQAPRTLGMLIREARRRMSLPVSTAAKQLGVRHEFLDNLEADYVPKKQIAEPLIKRCSTLFNLPLEVLRRGVGRLPEILPKSAGASRDYSFARKSNEIARRERKEDRSETPQSPEAPSLFEILGRRRSRKKGPEGKQ